MIFHYFNIIKLYRKVCDQFGNILTLKYAYLSLTNTFSWFKSIRIVSNRPCNHFV